MNDSAERTANQCVEGQIDEFAQSLETCLDMDLLTYLGPLLYGADSILRKLVEARAARRPNLMMMLETSGGYVEPVRRIVAVLRRHYDRIEFIVPDHAMSAGTVLVVSGDAIHMDYYSTLGPIDPQTQGSQGTPISALGYLVQYNRLLSKANRGKASSAELAMLLNFDQGDLYSYEQDRELSIQLLEEWLVKYKFRDWKTTETRKKRVTDGMKRKRAREVAKILNDTDRWHTHGAGITMEVLRRDLSLRIDDFGSNQRAPDLPKWVKLYHGLMIDYMHRLDQRAVAHTTGRFVFPAIGGS